MCAGFFMPELYDRMNNFQSEKPIAREHMN